MLTARFILHLQAWKERESFKMTGRDEDGDYQHPPTPSTPHHPHLPQPPPAMLQMNSFHGDPSTSYRRGSNASPSSPQSVSDSSTLVGSSPRMHHRTFGDDKGQSVVKGVQDGSGAGSSFWMGNSEVRPVSIDGRTLASRGSEERLRPLRRESVVHWV
jgi:hypothetical protein